MKIRPYLFIGLLAGVLIACGGDEKDPAVNPIVGKWERNFYQFKNLPGTHDNYENLMLPSPYVIGTTGIYDEKLYELTFNEDETFKRKLIFYNNATYSDDGTWEIQNSELTIDSKKSANDEVFKLHSNSGTSMALYQRQSWLLLPDRVIDTLTEEYYNSHRQMIFDEYAQEIDLDMFYFFKKVE